MTEPTDVIRLYLDDDNEPFKTARPPLRFQFSTLHLADGPHRLRIEAHNGLAGESVREVPFNVRNGVAITVSGLTPGQEIAGQVGVIINAYAGNTEVDFEPSRAETPQPIPTWAWLIFLAIIAWTMFYVLNPHPKPAVAGSARVSAETGERVYLDTCAKCHQEDGLGAPGLGPAVLKDNDRVLDVDPIELVSYVAAGPLPEDTTGGGAPARPRMKMLPFGPPKLTNLEFVGVLNHVRSHFGNQAPLIIPEAKRFPADLRAFEDAYRSALQRKDVEAVWQLYSDDERTRLVRPGAESIDVSTKKAVVDTLRTWLDSIKNVNSLSLEDTAYHLFEGGKLLYAHGTVKLEVAPLNGGPSQQAVGQFIRMYALEKCKRMPRPETPELNEQCYCSADGSEAIAWRLVFDYATTPMQIGCDPGLGGREGELCPRSEIGRISFADVRRILESLGERAPNAPHQNFWDLPYADFLKFEFPLDRKLPDAGRIRLLNLDPAAGISGSETNLVKGLRDGKDVLVTLPGGGTRRVAIPRMPKSAKPLSPVDLARIISWIDHGMPEGSGKDEGMAGPGMATGPVAPGMTTPPPGPGPEAGKTDPGAGMGGDVPAAAGAWREDDVDFAGVVKILKDMNGKSSGSPHGKFWELPYAQFVAYEFESNTEPGKIRLVVPGKSAESNLIRGMRGEPLVRVDATGKPRPFDVGKMPPKGKGKALEEKDLERVARWIDHGCPETRPGAGSTPPTPPTPPVAPPAVPTAPVAPPAAPAAPVAPPAVPVAPPAAPAAPTPLAGAGDLTFDGVIALLKKLNPKASGSPHGKFWDLPYDQFIASDFQPNTEPGKVRLLVLGKGAQSNLVRALRGEPLIRLTDDGKEVPFPVGQMPSKGKGAMMAPADIAKIERWIDAGCPK